MDGELKSLRFDPDPATLTGEPSRFAFIVRLIVGPTDGPGEESFDVAVCSPEWLAGACRRSGGIYDARHHVVVDFDHFDRRALEAWLSTRVEEAQADTWQEVVDRVARLGYWEFEDHPS